MNVDVKLIPTQYSATHFGSEVILDEYEVHENKPENGELIILCKYEGDRYHYRLYMAIWKLIDNQKWAWVGTSLSIPPTR